MCAWAVDGQLSDTRTIPGVGFSGRFLRHLRCAPYSCAGAWGVVAQALSAADPASAPSLDALEGLVSRVTGPSALPPPQLELPPAGASFLAVAASRGVAAPALAELRAYGAEADRQAIAAVLSAGLTRGAVRRGAGGAVSTAGVDAAPLVAAIDAAADICTAAARVVAADPPFALAPATTEVRAAHVPHVETMPYSVFPPIGPHLAQLISAVRALLLPLRRAAAAGDAQAVRRLCDGLRPDAVPAALQEEVWAIRDEAAEKAVAEDCTAALNAGRIGGWGIGRLRAAAPSAAATSLLSVASATCDAMGTRTPLSALLADAVRAMAAVRTHAASGQWSAAAAAAAALLKRQGSDLRSSLSPAEAQAPRPVDAAIAATAAECIYVVWHHRHAQLARHVRESLTGGGAAGGRVGSMTTAGVLTAPLEAALARLDAATAGIDASLSRLSAGLPSGGSGGAAPFCCDAFDPSLPVELDLAVGTAAALPPAGCLPRSPELARLGRTVAEVLLLRRSLVAREWRGAAAVVDRCVVRSVDPASGAVAFLPLGSPAAALLAAKVRSDWGGSGETDWRAPLPMR